MSVIQSNLFIQVMLSKRRLLDRRNIKQNCLVRDTFSKLSPVWKYLSINIGVDIGVSIFLYDDNIWTIKSDQRRLRAFKICDILEGGKLLWTHERSNGLIFRYLVFICYQRILKVFRTEYVSMKTAWKESLSRDDLKKKILWIYNGWIRQKRK